VWQGSDSLLSFLSFLLPSVSLPVAGAYSPFIHMLIYFLLIGNVEVISPDRWDLPSS